MLTLIIGVLGNLLLAAQSAPFQTWQDLCPGRTTQAEILRRYGAPIHVVIRFVGFDAFETWRNTGSLSGYDFVYYGFSSSQSALQEGPLGEAHEVVVSLTADRKLSTVVWTYESGFHSRSRTGEGPTQITVAQIEAVLGGSPIIKKFEKSRPGLPSAAIYRFRKQRFVIEVLYLGAGSNVEVHLSRQGAFVLE